MNALTNTAKGLIKNILFRIILRNLKVEQLLTNKREHESHITFGIVHYNAPNFLRLNIKRLTLLHPEAKIYVFDNASSEENLKAILTELGRYENVTLFSNRRDYSNTWACHIIGLQFLLNYAAKKQDSTITFLDQDCILANQVYDLINKLEDKEALLVGVRDYVKIPKDYGYLKKGTLRNYPEVMHASFMMMNPVLIRKLFGKYSLMDGKSFEPYHGIARKVAGKTLFLETQMHPEIPLLTRYIYEGKTYAWHSWYSSRIFGMKDTEFLNNLPVFWLKECLKKAYTFMEQLTLENAQK
ncbi:MAG: glycosyltransferase [Candidatus Bathyarchaeia archaeon]